MVQHEVTLCMKKCPKIILEVYKIITWFIDVEISILSNIVIDFNITFLNHISLALNPGSINTDRASTCTCTVNYPQ